MASKYGVRGAKELTNTFRELARAPTQAQRRRAREAAMLPVRDVARAALVANGSYDDGALWASLGVAQHESRSNRTIMGSRSGKFRGKRPSSIAHLVELGTRPHWQPNRFGGIMHPGARPKPFLRVAAEAMAAIAPPIYARVIYEEVAAAAQRASVRQPRRRK